MTSQDHESDGRGYHDNYKNNGARNDVKYDDNQDEIDNEIDCNDGIVVDVQDTIHDADTSANSVTGVSSSCTMPISAGSSRGSTHHQRSYSIGDNDVGMSGSSDDDNRESSYIVMSSRDVSPDMDNHRAQPHTQRHSRGRRRVNARELTLVDLLDHGFVREGLGVLKLGSLDGESGDLNPDGTVCWGDIHDECLDQVALAAYNHTRASRNLPHRRVMDVWLHCYFNDISLDVLRGLCARAMEDELGDGMVLAGGSSVPYYSASYDESMLMKAGVDRCNQFISRDEAKDLDLSMARSRSNSRSRHHHSYRMSSGDEVDQAPSEEEHDDNLDHRKGGNGTNIHATSSSRFGITMKDLMQCGLLIPGKGYVYMLVYMYACVMYICMHLCIRMHTCIYTRVNHVSAHRLFIMRCAYRRFPLTVYLYICLL